MPQHPEALDHMLAAWNERDPERIRGHLNQALSEDVEFCDPQNGLCLTPVCETLTTLAP